MEPGTAALAALRKAASRIASRVFTGPGPGAGTVDRPLKVSRIPGVERTRQTIGTEDLRRFAAETLKRGAKAGSGTAISRDDRERIALAVASMVYGLPRETIDMELLLAVDMKPDLLADALRTGTPLARRELPEWLHPVLDETLAACCAHIVEFFSRRENFAVAAAVELLRETGDHAQSPEADDVVQVRADYSRLLRKRVKQIRLFGLDLYDYAANQGLDLVTGFVDLSIESFETGRLGGSGHERLEWHQLEELVARHRRILLEGPAGSGKTTLLQRLTLHYLDQFGAPTTSHPIVPFLLRLREFVTDGKLFLPPPRTFVQVLAPPLAGRLRGWEHTLFIRGSAAILVDGVDEIPAQFRRQALDWLTDLVELYPNTIFAVTSRPAAVDDSWRTELRTLNFTTASINPMTHQKVAMFIDHWHHAASLLPQAEPGDLLQDAASLKQVIRSRRDLARIAATPLLCAMVCALYRADNRTLPQNRTALYDRACTMLLEKRDRQQNIRTLPFSLSRDQVEPFLAELALWMLLNRRRSMAKDEALRQIERLLPALRTKDADEKPSAATILRYLLERSGLLQDPTMESLEFLHPSFQDYLAARKVFQNDYLQHLIDNAHDPLYHDVAIMAAGQVQGDPDRQNRLLDGLVRRAQTDPAHGRQLMLLAAACVADLGMVDPDRMATVQAETRSVLPPRSKSESGFLATAGDFVLDLLVDVLRDHEFTDYETVATVAAVAAIDVDNPVSIGIMQALAARQPYAVRGELAAVWHQSSDPEMFLDQVLASVDFSGFELTVSDPELVPLVARLQAVTRLTLVEIPATGIPWSAPLPHLCSLTLSRMNGLDTALLTAMPHLTTVTLDNMTELRPDGLAMMPRLEHLATRGSTQVPVAVLELIPGLVSLAVEQRVSDIELEELATLGRLTQLSATLPPEDGPAKLLPPGDLNVAIKQGRGIVALRRLTRLSAYAEDISDFTLLEALPELTELELVNPTPNHLKELTRIPRLRSLLLTWDHTHGGDSPDLSQLRSLVHLERLALRGLDSIYPTELATLPRLTRLDLALLPRADLSGLQILPHLTELGLESMPWVDVTSLAALPHLSGLELCRTAIPNPIALLSLPRLTDLTIVEMPTADLSAVVAAAPALARLTLRMMPGVDISPVRVAHPRITIRSVP